MFGSPQKSEAKKPGPPTQRLIIADYVINGAVGSAHTASSGNTYGSATAVGRNISLEATVPAVGIGHHFRLQRRLRQNPHKLGVSTSMVSRVADEARINGN